MAYTWEPRWEPVRIEVYGIVIHTCRDKVTKMIACPICIDAASKCLGKEVEKTSVGDVKSKNMFFFTAEDLIMHIRDYHSMGFLRRQVSVDKNRKSAG